MAACAQGVATDPCCLVYWSGACVALGAHLGAVRALGGRRPIEGLGEVVAWSNLAVLRALLASLDVRVSGCIAVHCADGANRLWETITDADVKVRI